MVQGNAVGIGQRDAPSACIGCGGVGLPVEANVYGLAICSVSCPCNHDVGGDTGGVAQGAAFGRIKQSRSVATAHGITCNVGYSQCWCHRVNGQVARLRAAVVVAVGAADLDRVGFVGQAGQDR
jgi:hypothetical protein